MPNARTPTWQLAVFAVFVAMISLYAGCSKTPDAGLLVNNGIPNANQVQYVIYQSSTWTTLQPQMFPLQRPYQITDTAAIQAFYTALNHPSGGLMPKTASNSRVGFITKDGRVVIFAVGGAECESAKADLSAALKLAFATKRQQEYDTTTVPFGKVANLKYNPGKGGKTITLTSGTQLLRVEKVWRQLLSTYNPLSLRGNVHCSPQEVTRFLAWVPEYLEVKVEKPVDYEAIVVPPNLDPKWPPDRGDNRSNLKKLQYDTIYVARLPETRSKFVRFIFTSSTGDCLATDAVDPRNIVNYAGKFGQPTFGPDLFDEVVSTLTKP